MFTFHNNPTKIIFPVLKSYFEQANVMRIRWWELQNFLDPIQTTYRMILFRQRNVNVNNQI